MWRGIVNRLPELYAVVTVPINRLFFFAQRVARIERCLQSWCSDV
jgi:hypothetical protein